MPHPQPPKPSHSELSQLLADRRWIVGLCRKLLSHSADADDLVQETAARALQADALGDEAIGRGVDVVGRARRGRAWLAQAARRISLEQRRSERHRGDREFRYGQDTRDDSRVVEPVEALARAEFRERVARLVMALPDAEREAIVLRFYEGLDYGPMSEVTGARAEALRQRVSRGLARIKEQLGAEDGAEKSAGGRPWQALALGVLAEVPASKAGAGKLVAAAALLLGAGTAAAFWVTRTEAPSSIARTSSPDPLALGVEEELASLPSANVESRVEGLREADPESTIVAAAGEAQPVEVRLVDDATGAPVAGQPWLVIQTGDFDLGQRSDSMFWSGSVHPNPEPIASGVTDEDGFARFPLPEHDLVNLVTERSGRFAFGSFPVEIEDGEAVTAEVRLGEGRALFGSVVDDRGEPFPGAVLVGSTYGGEPVVLGTAGEGGAYRIERLANFPRSFQRVYAGGAPTGEIRAATKRASRLSLWPSLEAFEERRCEPRNISYGFYGSREGDTQRRLVLWRWRTLRGVVVNEQEEPVEGVRVAVLFRQEGGVEAYVPGALAPSSEHIAGMWEHCDVTDADGAFELLLKHNDLETKEPSQRDLVAVALDGRMTVEVCDALPFGEEMDGIRLVLGPSRVTRVHLTDPDGDISETHHVGDLAALCFVDGGQAQLHRCLLAVEGERAELTFWRERISGSGPGEGEGALLIVGYEPVVLDLAEAPADMDVTLQRRPGVSLTVDVTGDGLRFVESLTLRVVYVPMGASPPTTVDFESLEGWELRGDVRPGVAPGVPVRVLARPGEQAYLRVTMESVHGQLHEDSPIMVLAAPGFGSGFQASVEAPAWGAGTNANSPDHPLIKQLHGKLKVDLIDAVTGELVLPWSFRAECTGGDFKGKVDYREHSRRFGAYAGQASLRFEARGYEPLELGPIEFCASETVDLGQLSMTRRDALAVQLYRPDGEPAKGTRMVKVPDVELSGRELPPGTLTEIAVAPGGDFLLDHALGNVATLVVSESNWGSWLASQRVTLERDQEGGLRATLLRWQYVELRLTGLSGASLFASDNLVVKDAAGLCPSVSAHHEASSTLHSVYRTRLAPGRWVVTARPGSPVTFDPLEFEITELEDSQELTVIDIAARPRD